MTKAEQKILDTVKHTNERGALCGLAPSRFVDRLSVKGEIVYIKNPKHGGGWALHDQAGKFQE